MSTIKELEDRILQDCDCGCPGQAGDHAACEIDAAGRTILYVPDIVGVAGDESSNRIPFTCPRIVGDGLDLASCTIRINWQNAAKEIGSYYIDDLRVNDDTVTFSWNVTRAAAAYKGVIRFIVCAFIGNEDGTIAREWNTTVASSNVLEGIEPIDSTEVETPVMDILTQLMSYKDTAKAAINAAKEDAVDELEEMLSPVLRVEDDEEEEIEVVEAYELGDLASLKTEDKTSAVAAINEIKDAIGNDPASEEGAAELIHQIKQGTLALEQAFELLDVLMDNIPLSSLPQESEAKRIADALYERNLILPDIINYLGGATNAGN